MVNVTSKKTDAELKPSLLIVDDEKYPFGHQIDTISVDMENV